MVDAELGRDLLSFGKPILVLGDPGATAAGQGRRLLHRGRARRDADRDPSPGARTIRSSACPRSCARAARSPTANMARAASSAATRSTPPTCSPPTRCWSASTAPAASTISASARLRGTAEPLPVAGDKLVCLRNDRVKGLINGGLWRVEDARRHAQGLRAHDGALGGRARPRRSQGRGAQGNSSRGSRPTCPIATRRESDEFDYGYALTVHKAQGSQWDSVVLFDESRAFREHRARWLYTGLTRAARRLTLVR